MAPSAALCEADVLGAAGKYDAADVLVCRLAGRGAGEEQAGALRGALRGCARLLELDLANNALESLQFLEGLAGAATIRRLTLTANSLGSLKGARQLTSLEHLLVQQNAITGVADLALEELAELPKLQSLYLANVDGSQRNAVCSVSGYRSAVLRALPKLRILDGERLNGAGAATMREASHCEGGIEGLEAAAESAELALEEATAAAEAALGAVEGGPSGGLEILPLAEPPVGGAGDRLALALSEAAALCTRAGEATKEAERRAAVEGALGKAGAARVPKAGRRSAAAL